MLKKKVLLIGFWLNPILATLQLFYRADFLVDVYTAFVVLKHSKKIRNFVYVKSPHEALKEINLELINAYDEVVICDDILLKLVKDSSLDLSIKSAVLPVINYRYMSHLYSKIELSKTMSDFGITTPKYEIVLSEKNFEYACNKIGFPFFVKVDASFGGQGVYECCNQEDIKHVLEKDLIYPLLIQKKIIGQELSIEVFYKKTKIIYFALSKILDVDYKYGPSSLREYWSPQLTGQDVIDELSRLGQALGADGFCNISIIESLGVRYYFEADMRPNAWVDHCRYTGFDPILPIQNYYKNGVFPKWINHKRLSSNSGKIIPYFNRFSLWQIIKNDYQVRAFFPENESLILLFLLGLKIKSNAVYFLQAVLPKKLYFFIRDYYKSKYIG